MATVSIHNDSTPVSAGGLGAGSYDVVVIGAGMGGLTAGALLARAGRSVLVVEAEQQPGGYVHALREGPYTFDLADHLVTGCEREGPFGAGIIDAVLRHLEVRDRCDFIRIDAPVFEVRFPDFRFAVPGGRDAYLEAYRREFPAQTAGVRKLVDVGDSVYREWLRFPMQPRWREMLTVPWRFPTLFRYRNATIGEVIDRELGDPRLKSVYAALSRWLGLPPARESFAMWAFAMAAYVDQGAYYCRGSFQALADAVAEALARAGGELVLGRRVTRIIAPDQKVEAVELETGERISARQVISNIDPRETFGALLEPQRLPGRYRRRLQRGALSPDGASLYLATDLDVKALGAPFDSFLFTSWDLDHAYERATAGELTWLGAMIPTLADPTLAPPGEHIVNLVTGPLPHASNAASSAERIAPQMLELAEQILPGLQHHLTHVAGRNGHDEQDFPVRRTNAFSGWDTSPQHSGVRRLPPRTPIRGLLLVGQWTQPGVGVMTVIASAIQAARLALGIPGNAPVLPIGLPTAPKPATATR